MKTSSETPQKPKSVLEEGAEAAPEDSGAQGQLCITRVRSEKTDLHRK